MQDMNQKMHASKWKTTGPGWRVRSQTLRELFNYEGQVPATPQHTWRRHLNNSFS
jgi:hypothetical protein